MAVFNGIRHFGAVTSGIRTCGVVACSTDRKDSCAKVVPSLQPVSFQLIEIIGNFDLIEDVFDMPVALTANLGVLQNYKFCKQRIGFSDRLLMSVENQKDLFSFGFFGRMYSFTEHEIYVTHYNKVSSNSWLYILMGLTAIFLIMCVIFIYVAQNTELKNKIA